MIIMAKWNLETPSLVICPFRAIYKYLNKYSKKYYESIFDFNDIEQSIVESINNVKKKFVEPSLSHLTRMNRKKSDVNQYANQCELFQ